jgi:hypothetical protein
MEGSGFTSGERVSYPYMIEGRVGPRADLEAVKNRKISCFYP